jgi:FixJ family two-component response regulator
MPHPDYSPVRLDPRSRVFIVDDDAQTLRAFERILRIEGLSVTTFTSAAEFLGRTLEDVPSCLLLDLHLPGIDGLRLQEEMRQASERMPIVFVSGSADVSSTASAMRYGAVDFLQKPVEDAQLLAAVSRALEQDAAQRLRHDDMTRARERLAQLTQREREVCELVARGLLNKQIAAALGPSLRTIKIHRARMMRKLGAASVADVVRLLARIEPQTATTPRAAPDYQAPAATDSAGASANGRVQ